MTIKQPILIVDDDPSILELLEHRFTSAGLSVLTASDGFQALDILKEQDAAAIVADIKMPGMDGMELLKEVRSTKPELPIIFITAYGTIPDAVDFLKAGAVDYIPKPFDGRQLLDKVYKLIDQGDAPTGEKFYDGLSPKMKELENLVKRVTASDVSLIILGESGVGKERIARYIHQNGRRSGRPFTVVDCGSTPTGLLESELFGHVKGAFTHALRDKKGLIEASHTGTLFLDEIGNISPEMQVRLLRFLEDRKIRKIGDTKTIKIDCRIISATNSNLTAEVEAGNFREDLYFRLHVVTITVPPLRERKEDIVFLCQQFVENFSKHHGVPKVEIPPETLELLCSHSWPGNVRELKNAIEAGVVLSKNGTLNPDVLMLTGAPKVSENNKNNGSSFSLLKNERDTILRALDQTGGNRKEAAKLLRISRRTIHYKIKKFKIESF